MVAVIVHSTSLVARLVIVASFVSAGGSTVTGSLSVDGVLELLPTASVKTTEIA